MNYYYPINKNLKVSLMLLAAGLSLNISNLFAGQKGKGVELAYIDSSFKPQDDFYEFANNKWLQSTEIPSSEARWGSFNILMENNQKNLHNLFNEISAKKDFPKGSNGQKISDFYATSMDTVTLNKLGVQPIQKWLAAIDSVKTTSDLTKLTARLHRLRGNIMWGASVFTDLKKSDENALYVGQNGQGLPDPDYYLKKDPESVELQKKYVTQISKMLQFTGLNANDAASAADVAMKIETRLAGASMNAVKQRDYEAQYNKMSMDEFKKLCPAVNWDEYFALIGVKNLKTLIVAQPDFMKEINKMYADVSINDWKSYLRWHVIDGASPFLSQEIDNQNWEFFEGTLNGAKAQKARWKRSLQMIDGTMGEALGQLYVEKYFTQKSKDRVNEMVDNIMAVYRERIQQLDWMSDSTKKMAQIKLNAIIRKLGFPDKWKDYSALVITRDSYFKNIENAMTFAFFDNIDKLGKPVDKTLWGMSPPTVNAYYNPSINEIVFPAGIMQAPFFNAEADDAVNYACIGTVIGHEITHGFDDQGSQFDSQGNMINWWSESDKNKFNEKTKLVIEQFNGYVAIDTLHVIGALTVGENIADLGGFSISFAAMQRSWKTKGKPEKIDGLTPEQRFFLAGAQMWRTKYRDEALKKQVLTNPHSPGKFRVIGPFSNMPEFYETWNVKPGDKMYRPDNIRAKIW